MASTRKCHRVELAGFSSYFPTPDDLISGLLWKAGEMVDLATAESSRTILVTHKQSSLSLQPESKMHVRRLRNSRAGRRAA
jgi:hypothetical protein